jgi:hypothetical protein
MNVRFFGGTRKQYDGLATPRNPMGLYFCADTRELFWGDKLLTDGTRIVATEAERPSLAQAADGITYFVEETRNGYVISPDRTKWIQVIHAPEGGESVKAISFAGIEMEEVDGVFTIDRRCAREALGFIVPEGLEDEDIEIVTKEYIDEKIAEIPGADIDLSEYVKQEEIADLATKEFVQAKIAEAELADQDVDLSAYYTKSETETAIKAAVDEIKVPDVSGFATKSELEGVQETAGNNSVKIMAIDSELLDIKQQLENIPTTDLSGYATKDEVATVEAKIPSIEGLATESYVDKKVAAIVIPEVPTKVSELENDAGYITAKDIPETDLSNYYNKAETENLIAEAVKDIEHPTVDLEGYATEEWVNAQGFLTEHQDLSEYAKKSDLPQPELFVVDYNAPNFTAALEAYNSGKLLLLTNAAPDGNGYAIMNYVRDDLITFTKFLMSRSGTYGAFNTYYLHNDNSWELAKEVKLNKVEAVADSDRINGITIGKETYTFDYVTNETLEQKNYVTEQYVTNNYITQDVAKETYVTTEKVIEVVETQVDEVITKEIETKVETVIQEKVDRGEIEIKVDSISYGDFEDDLI